MDGRERVYWFPAKSRGWGWGPPVTWQGRLFLGLWVAIVIPSSPLLVQRSFPLFLLFFVGMLAVLLAVCFAKGEPAKWRS